MSRSTIVLGFLTLLLATACGAAWWHLAAAERPAPGGSVDSFSFGLGLPEIGDEDTASDEVAESVVWWDGESGSMRTEQQAFEQRPIASLTKLMTAMVALDHGIAWDTPADILPDEYVIGGRLLLHPGEQVTMRDLFHASLVGSANNATLAYVRALGLPQEEFVSEMNRKAIALGLEQTHFVEVTGLDSDNVSTAYEAARLAEAAFRDYPDIARATSLLDYSLTAIGSGREHTIRNTNKLISEEGFSFMGSKTGYLHEAGYCLVVRGAGESAEHIAVILGASSENQSLAAIKQLVQQFE